MLTETQARLERHFSSLRDDRAACGYPVYAFEHGLEIAEVEAVRDALSRELKISESLNRDHWLLWMAVAAEVGYAYDGDEYWTTFAREVPGWSLFGSRESIRSWFQTFAKSYAGFRPGGRWALHFPIIAWPIAHAILPRDLQSLFARRLYDLRYDLARSAVLSPSDIGALVRSEKTEISSRFENFLQQTELTGRLVLALRDEDVPNTVAAIYKPTLSRIVADLERRQAARAWLREARQVLRLARLHQSGGLAHRVASASGAKSENVKRLAGPRLCARQSSEGPWTLGVVMPDFAAMVTAAGVPHKTLEQTRFRLADRPDSWMPGRAMLTLSLMEQPISSLAPFLDGPALRFECNIPVLSSITAAGMGIAGCAPWLLRIHEDSIARQVFGNHVRAGQTYLLLSQAPITPHSVQCLNLQLQECRTASTVVYLLMVPAALDEAYLQALAGLKLGYALSAVVEPVGLVPRWDGSAGGTVWLVNEEPLLRLSADCPVKEFLVRIGQNEPTRILVGESAEAVISLGMLPIGHHVVEISGIIQGPHLAMHDCRLDAEYLLIEIRAPQPWRQGVRAQAGFRVGLEPANATLESVINGKATITLIGPPERQVAVEARTFDFNGHLSRQTKLGRVTLPVGDAAIRRLLQRLNKEPLCEAVQSSPRLDLVFLVDELGMSSLSLQQRIKPLRWKLETSDTGPRVRLIDEAGAKERVVVARFDIRAPDKCQIVDPAQCLSGIELEPPGALLTAKFGGKRYSAFVSVPEKATLSNLRDLSVAITLSESLNSLRYIPRMIALHRLWNSAQPLGPLAIVRKASVLQAFEHRIAALVCGQAWAERARQCLQGQPSLVDRLQRDIMETPSGFSARMRSSDWAHLARDEADHAEFLRLATTYQITDDSELCNLALTLAFDPDRIKFDNSDQGVAVFERLARIPPLARGAYFARLVADLAAQEFLKGSAPA